MLTFICKNCSLWYNGGKKEKIMSVITDRREYQRRVIDKTIERYLQVSGAICIEGPKW